MAGRGVGDATRNTRPAVQAAWSRRTYRAATGAEAGYGNWGRSLMPKKGQVERKHSVPNRNPAAVERHPSARGSLKRSSPPGVKRSKPINTARGAPGIRQLRDDDACVHLTHIVHRVTGLLWPRRSARPRLWREAKEGMGRGACPAPGQRTRAMSHVCFSSTLPWSERGGVRRTSEVHPTPIVLADAKRASLAAAHFGL